MTRFTSIKKKSHIKGVTILEVILVLVIMGGILFLSISQYMAFQRDADVIRVQTNVDLIYNAMVKYFRANCNIPNSPFTGYYNAQSLTIPMSFLIIGKYLVIENNIIPSSPIANVSRGNNAYLLQFNQIQTPTPPFYLPERTIKTGSQTAPKTTSLGAIELWQIQVAVELSDKANATLYKNLLGADCLSNRVAGTIVTPCDQAPANANQYAVWSRLPSFASSQANSNYWESKPILRQFSQMYSTSPILSLTNNTATGSQYYTCGGN